MSHWVRLPYSGQGEYYLLWDHPIRFGFTRIIGSQSWTVTIIWVKGADGVLLYDPQVTVSPNGSKLEDVFVGLLKEILPKVGEEPYSAQQKRKPPAPAAPRVSYVEPPPSPPGPDAPEWQHKLWKAREGSE